VGGELKVESFDITGSCFIAISLFCYHVWFSQLPPTGGGLIGLAFILPCFLCPAAIKKRLSFAGYFVFFSIIKFLPFPI